MNNDSQPAGPEEEVEEIFVDAITSPANEQEVPTLRRSTRKRKSVSGGSDLEAQVKTQKFTGKRPRPIPNMHRTPDATKKDAPQAQAGRSSTRGAHQSNGASPDLRGGGVPTPGPSLTISTDPPTETQTQDQVLMLGGLRAVLREELNKTEVKLANRLQGVEAGLSTIKSDFRSLENRVEQMERRFDDLSLIHI